VHGLDEFAIGWLDDKGYLKIACRHFQVAFYCLGWQNLPAKLI